MAARYLVYNDECLRRNKNMEFDWDQLNKKWPDVSMPDLGKVYTFKPSYTKEDQERASKILEEYIKEAKVVYSKYVKAVEALDKEVSERKPPEKTKEELEKEIERLKKDLEKEKSIPKYPWVRNPDPYESDKYRWIQEKNPFTPMFNDLWCKLEKVIDKELK